MKENNCKHNEEELFQNWNTSKLVNKNNLRMAKKENFKNQQNFQSTYIYRENADHKIYVNYSNTFKICQINNAGINTYILYLQLSIPTSLLYSIAY